jgi:excinuclease ABC subunit B
VQTIGRAARNTDGRVIMYADSPTDSMMRAIGETTRRRDIQRAYNEQHGITPESINVAVRALIEIAAETEQHYGDRMSEEDKQALIRALEDKMLSAAGELDFEKAAHYRDELFQLQGKAPLEKEQPQQAKGENPEIASAASNACILICIKVKRLTVVMKASYEAFSRDI